MSCYIIHSGKPYEELGERQQRRKRQKIKESITNHTAGLQEIGFDVVSVKLQTINGDDVDLRIKPSSNGEPNKADPVIEDKENSVTYMRLTNEISSTNYYELSMIFKESPRSHKVCKHI